jgi:hypothetical protein
VRQYRQFPQDCSGVSWWKTAGAVQDLLTQAAAAGMDSGPVRVENFDEARILSDPP